MNESSEDRAVKVAKRTRLGDGQVRRKKSRRRFRRYIGGDGTVYWEFH